MAAMTSTAQDSSADSNVWNTQGPSANHGSINFNFHVNNENFTSPVGPNGARGQDPKHLDQLLKQNHFLKTIISQIAPSIIPEAALQPSRRRRSAEEAVTTRRPLVEQLPHKTARRYDGTQVKCSRPPCFLRRTNHFRTTTTPRPYLPLPLLRKIQKPGDCVLDYFSGILKSFRGFESSPKPKKLVSKAFLGKIH